MFKFLKEKISSWLKGSKEEIEKKVEKKEKQQRKVEEIKGKEKQAVKKAEKKSRKSAADLSGERETTAKVIEDIKKEELEIKTPEDRFEAEIKKEFEEEQEETEKEDRETKEEKQKQPGFFQRLKKIFVYKITKEDFSEIFENLENLFLENNVALEVVERIKADIEKQLIGKEIKKQDIEKEIKLSLKKSLEEIIIDPDDIIETIKEAKKEGVLFKIIFFGINGSGKTTSIAKFANLCLKNNLSCVLAAADTFRAASIEQLQIHADKLGVKMIKQNYGSDPSAVAFDSIKYAQNHKIDVVLIDTAGRMHTKENLLKEMEKICRVTKPDLKIFVAEAIAGNDAIEQAKAFNDMVEIDGSILSKTDIDEKGGTIISISYITHKPIFYLGTGQNYQDLELFNKREFIKKLGLM